MMTGSGLGVFLRGVLAMGDFIAAMFFVKYWIRTKDRFFFYFIVSLFWQLKSAFAGFPRLASLLARDGYMPHQMAEMGDRLMFSNGIIILGAFFAFLIFHFRAIHMP